MARSERAVLSSRVLALTCDSRGSSPNRGRLVDDDPPVARDDDLWIPVAVVVQRVLLAVAANEIIIGGLSHSLSTAAWLSGWLFGDGGGGGGGSGDGGSGGCIPSLGDCRRRGCESNGARCLCERARKGGRE